MFGVVIRQTPFVKEYFEAAYIFIWPFQYLRIREVYLSDLCIFGALYD